VKHQSIPTKVGIQIDHTVAQKKIVQASSNHWIPFFNGMEELLQSSSPFRKRESASPKERGEGFGQSHPCCALPFSLLLCDKGFDAANTAEPGEESL
jgi:hypothetical protein